VIVSIIVAMDEAGGIGKGGGLPWHLSADLKNFKALTMDHHLIVGRKTYESIGRVLPDGRSSSSPATGILLSMAVLSHTR